ncbi:MAG TPA: hypothetical protein VK473_03975 [Terriglobales bacterium]|nr:hypothetical protein [Terriglobales bacterium]
MSLSRPAATALWVLLLAALPVSAQFNTRETSTHPASNWIPDGTHFIVRLDNTLDTAKIDRGKHFSAKLAEDLAAPNGAMIPRGEKIKGHVSDVEHGLHGRILLSFDQINTPHGWMPLAATVTDIPGEHSLKANGDEGEIERKGRNKTHVAEDAAVGAGVGAIAGAAAGGGRGAAIGAAAGAAVGTGTGFLTDRNLKLEKGQQLELSLDRPLEVPLR